MTRETATLTDERRAEAERMLAAERERAARANGWQMPGEAARHAGRRVVLTPASEIVPEPLRWLWRQRLPLRGLSVIAGEPGLGKSTLTVELAADVTRGRLDGDLHDAPHDVLIATAEDHS